MTARPNPIECIPFSESCKLNFLFKMHHWTISLTICTEKDVPVMYIPIAVYHLHIIALLIDVTHVICKKYE